MGYVSIMYKYNLYRMLRYEMQFRNEGEMFSLSQIPIWESNILQSWTLKFHMYLSWIMYLYCISTTY